MDFQDKHNTVTKLMSSRLFHTQLHTINKIYGRTKEFSDKQFRI